MPKSALFISALLVIMLTSIATLLFNTVGQKPTPKSEIDSAINQAKFLYQQKKQRGDSLANGPCLSDALMPGWVADTVHSPRSEIDDLPENQCPSFREGRVRHFVELDMEGDLVRAK